MKRTLCFLLILTFALSATAFAQRAIPRGRVTRNLPSVELFTPKADFDLGETVQFTLRVTQAPLSVQQSYFTIEKLVGNDTWVEFYRSAQNPFGQGFMAPNTEQNFGWGQTNTKGDRTADPGTWRIKLFLAGGSGSGTPIMAAFNIVQASGGGGGQGGALEMKLMRYKLVLGETAAFRLQNVGNREADLRGHSYVIQYQQGNRWLDFFKSSVDPLDIRSLAPGQIYKFIWTQKNRQGQLGGRGIWRIVFYAPNVPNTPVSAEFSIR
jgi:hypothetical protein